MKLIDINREYTVAELAYMAGIIDGEGSLTISAYETPKRNIFQAAIGIASTDKILIDWIYNVFGGWQGEYTPKQTPKNSRKKVFRWQIQGRNIDLLLPLIKPYIVIKKQEIELVQQYRKTFGSNYGSAGVTPEVIAIRKKLSNEIRKLHCRG